MKLFPIRIESSGIDCEIAFASHYEYFIPSPDPNIQFKKPQRLDEFEGGYIRLQNPGLDDADTRVQMEFRFWVNGNLLDEDDDQLTVDDAVERYRQIVIKLARYVERSVGGGWLVRIVTFDETNARDLLCHYNHDNDPGFSKEFGYEFRHGFYTEYRRAELFPPDPVK